MNIRKAQKHEYPIIMKIWESSVKKTHHFLKEEDFIFYKEIIPNALPQVNLFFIENEHSEPLGFMGVNGDTLEMLFVHSNYIGKGLGKLLLKYALEKLNVTKVDVNEQNFSAVDFYKKFGFKIIGRSEKDLYGKNYPILHASI